MTKQVFMPETYIWFVKLRKWIGWKSDIYAYWEGKYQPIEDEM